MCTVQDVRQKFPDWPHGMLTTYNAVVPLGTTGLLYYTAVLLYQNMVFSGRRHFSVFVLSVLCDYLSQVKWQL